MPNSPELARVTLSVILASPPTEVLNPSFSPFNMSILGSVVPLKEMVPELEAVPAISRRAVGLVVPIPNLPVLMKEFSLAKPAR